MYCADLCQLAKGITSDLHVMTAGGGNTSYTDEIDYI